MEWPKGLKGGTPEGALWEMGRGRPMRQGCAGWWWTDTLGGLPVITPDACAGPLLTLRLHLSLARATPSIFLAEFLTSGDHVPHSVLSASCVSTHLIVTTLGAKCTNYPLKTPGSRGTEWLNNLPEVTGWWVGRRPGIEPRWSGLRGLQHSPPYTRSSLCPGSLSDVCGSGHL